MSSKSFATRKIAKYKQIIEEIDVINEFRNHLKDTEIYTYSQRVGGPQNIFGWVLNGNLICCIYPADANSRCICLDEEVFSGFQNKERYKIIKKYYGVIHIAFRKPYAWRCSYIEPKITDYNIVKLR